MAGTPAAKPKLSYGHGAGGPALLGCTISEALDRTASVHPDQLALIAPHQQPRSTYREFLAEVELAARGFLCLGDQKGDRVGIWGPNYADGVSTEFATAKFGATP